MICDMWDQHWSRPATRRVAEMAPRMNEVVAEARRRGALIIHCPSDTLDFYKDTPQRALAKQAPVIETKIPLERWCRIIEAQEGKLPIDDSDGGCDNVPPCKNYKAWSRQIATIEIHPQDAITDSAEAFYLMRSRGIDNVIVVGVHTNMCVLGRPFSIRQLVRQGQNVMLLRDMTDTMYNPRMAPFVHHCTGTDLVIEHIEKNWCPTATSVDLVEGKEFRFSEDQRPHVAVLMAEDEYKTEQSLPAWGAKFLGKEFRTTYIFGNDTDRNDLPGIDALDQADVLLVSVRRRVPTKGQLDTVRRFIEAGKPVVGIRTASHAFSLRDGAPPPEGHDAWLTFDPDVLGGHYTGHHGEGLKVAVTVPGESPHPILTGVNVTELVGNGSLYKVNPLAISATPILIGSIPDTPVEPIAWTYTNKFGSRVFYTSLGHVGDFAEPAFQRLLLNGVRWAAGLPVEGTESK
ncbi:MAG: isochorismatase family protein [Planctomycetota bacterium]|nr:isochorismatase family protein [Planctomycetota bacterium]